MRAANVDANQPAVVAALRAAGASIEHLHAVGKGVPDLLVGFERRNYLLEVKNAAAGGKLNDEQLVWHRSWRGHAIVVTSPQQAFDFIRELARGARR